MITQEKNISYKVQELFLSVDSNLIKSAHACAICNLIQKIGEKSVKKNCIQKIELFALLKHDICLTALEPDAQLLIARLYRIMGDMHSAEIWYLKITPKSTLYLYGIFDLIFLKARMGDMNSAKKILQSAIEQYPDSLFVNQKRGEFYREFNLMNEYEEFVNNQLSSDSKLVACYNMGLFLYYKGSYQKAESWFLKAIRINFHLAELHAYYSHCLLAQNQWKLGFRELKWVNKIPFKKNTAPKKIPDLTNSKKQKNILIWNDSGMGDAIQFMRFVPMLIQAGYKVSFLIGQTSLAPLVRAQNWGNVYEKEEDVPSLEAKITFFDIPYFLGTEHPSLNIPFPYLNYPRKDNLLPTTNKKIKIGLVWAGTPFLAYDVLRSVKLEMLAPFFELPDIEWFNLKMQLNDFDVTTLYYKSKMIDLSDSINDFIDTANVLKEFDLLISIDTSVVHLAGALNLPVWLLLYRFIDWRWVGVKNKQSEWYPSLRIFNVAEKEGVQTVVDALLQLINSKNCVSSS